jgi:hypothetical protein
MTGEARSMAKAGWRIARTLSALLYFTGGLWLFERLDRGRRPEPRCTVLSYHRIARDPLGYHDIAVAPATFRKHLEYMLRHGFRFLSLSQYHEYLAGERPLDGDSVLITFDDGYRDNFTNAFPILQELVVRARCRTSGPGEVTEVEVQGATVAAGRRHQHGEVTPCGRDLRVIVRVVVSAVRRVVDQHVRTR